jgi:hypothetical protein
LIQEILNEGDDKLLKLKELGEEIYTSVLRASPLVPTNRPPACFFFHPDGEK